MARHSHISSPPQPRAKGYWGILFGLVLLALSATAATFYYQAREATAQPVPPEPRPESATSPASQPEPVADAKTFREHVSPFLKTHCVRCHGEEKQRGDLRLDDLEADFLGRVSSAKWIEVRDRLNLGEMPPQSAPRPDAMQLTKVIDWITSELSQAERQTRSTGGRVLLRRLSRTEYVNTIRDLLHVEMVGRNSPQEMLPPDGTVKGFNKASKGLFLDSSLLQTYLQVAERVAAKAVNVRPPRIPSYRLRFDYVDMKGSAMEYQLSVPPMKLEKDRVLVMDGRARSFGKLAHPYNDQQLPVAGKYIVRVRAGADPVGRTEPMYMDVVFGPQRLARFVVDAPLDSPKVYEREFFYPGKDRGEIQVGLVPGTPQSHYHHEAGVRFREAGKALQAGDPQKATRMRARLRAEGLADVNYYRDTLDPIYLDLDKIPKLSLYHIEIEGPLTEDWPTKSSQTVFFEGWEESQLTRDYAKRIFERLLPQAFRRPVRSEEVDALLSIVESELQRDKPFFEAVETGIVAMLCSPDFLYLFEPSDTASRRLTDYELASRLSYFLWSSMPDTELMRLAEAGQLRQADVLDAQIDRMLADPKSEALVQDFARQWLRIDEFDRFEPDQHIFPKFHATAFEGVGEDFQAEPLAFFREVLRKDESLLAFLQADWTMANERLAKWYGIEGVTGEAMQRMRFPADSPRGGLLTMAGVHQWGSDGNRTKPVERGKYVLDVLFNDPPPPPPPNAGEVQPNTGGKKLTVRERLLLHQEVEVCGNCHRRIDPYGLAMENFNVIGQWRERLDGEKPLAHWGNDRPAIDPGGTLPNGRSFANFAEFKERLLEQQDRYLRGLSEKLFLYALGRTHEPEDERTLDRIVAETKANRTTLRVMLKAIAKSEAFGVK